MIKYKIGKQSQTVKEKMRYKRDTYFVPVLRGLVCAKESCKVKC